MHVSSPITRAGLMNRRGLERWYCLFLKIGLGSFHAYKIKTGLKPVETSQTITKVFLGQEVFDTIVTALRSLSLHFFTLQRVQRL